MKSSYRFIAALVCAIALLALPAHAADRGGASPAPTSIDQLGSWLGSLWDGLVAIVVGNGPANEPSPPVDNDSGTFFFGDGGSCIDPDGCAH